MRARSPAVVLFSVYQALCPEDRCTVADADGLPILFDTDHVTAAGARLVSSKARQAGQF